MLPSVFVEARSGGEGEESTRGNMSRVSSEHHGCSEPCEFPDGDANRTFGQTMCYSIRPSALSKNVYPSDELRLVARLLGLCHALQSTIWI